MVTVETGHVSRKLLCSLELCMHSKSSISFGNFVYLKLTGIADGQILTVQSISTQRLCIQVPGKSLQGFE